MNFLEDQADDMERGTFLKRVTAITANHQRLLDEQRDKDRRALIEERRIMREQAEPMIPEAISEIKDSIVNAASKGAKEMSYKFYRSNPATLTRTWYDECISEGCREYFEKEGFSVHTSYNTEAVMLELKIFWV